MSKNSTNDQVIRSALMQRLRHQHATDERVRIINEMGINHGSVKADVAVVNGVMHAYEIKSDLDTLLRLPRQMDAYNSVFDKVTIVTGMNHLYDALEIIPDWWGITVAKYNKTGKVVLLTIREPLQNNRQDTVALARLLWKDEALQILEGLGKAGGMRSKPRSIIYQQLASCTTLPQLRRRVRQRLFYRPAWRADQPLLTRGG